MKTSAFIIAVVLGASACAAHRADPPEPVEPPGAAPEHTLENNAVRAMDDVLRAYVEEQRIGGVVALVAQRGQTIYSRALGLSDVERQVPMRTDTLFRLASMTKPITSVAAMMLVEQGRLRLDDPVAKYIPGFAEVEVYIDESTTAPVERPVTIEHLLTHTAGLGSSLAPQSPVDRQVASHDFSRVENLAGLVDELLGFPLVAQPGRVFNYGYSTDVLARVIEVATNSTIEAFLDQHLFTPLGMNDTFFTVPDEHKARLGPVYTAAQGTLREVVPAGHNPTRFGRGASGLVSTTGDYARFAAMLLGGGQLDGVRILRRETIELMSQNHLPEALLPVRPAGIEIANNGFGLGFATVLGPTSAWRANPEISMSSLGNLPGGSFYWMGAFNVYFWIDPGNQISGAVMTQSIDIGRIGIFQELYQALYQTLYQPR